MSAAEGPAVPADHPNLPPAYRLVALDDVDDVVAEGGRRARAGAEEGTLLWARRQRAAIVPGGPPPGHGDLLCAVVLRPELELEEVAQLAILGAAAARAALAAIAPPLSTLHCAWSGTVFLDGSAVGRVRLLPSAAGARRVEWVALGLGVRIVESSAAPPASAAASLQALGAETDPRELLAAYARHLLAWLDRWSSDGFAPLTRAWNGFLLPAEAAADPAYALEESGRVVATGRKQGRMTSWPVPLAEALGIAR